MDYARYIRSKARDGAFFTGSKGKQHKALFDSLVAKYGEPIGSGVHRCAFASKNVVVKLPITGRGQQANRREARYSQQDKRQKIAKARLVHVGGFDLVVMEKVAIKGIRIKNWPLWANKLDGNQFGLSRDGKLLAYDWAWKDGACPWYPSW